MSAHAERMRKLHDDPEFARKRSKWPECPQELWDEYRELQRRGLTAAQARETLEQRVAA